MPQRENYAQGVPAWVDLTTDDLEASKEFYTLLFGWDYTEVLFGAASYTMATLDGKKVAGLIQRTDEQIAQGPPPCWSTYLAVDDATATVAKVEPAGGHLLMPPIELLTTGVMAAIADNTETLVGLWQGGDHIGAELVNEPGTLIWNELVTGDAAAAGAFFTELLGWETSETELPSGPYTTFSVGGNSVGGITQKAHDHIENHWAAHFRVESIDSILGVVGHTDGLIDEPTDIGFGQVAAGRDPQGAMFFVMEINDSE